MRSILLLLALSLPAFAQSATARNANYWRSCTSTVTTNCNPRTDANGNLAIGATLPTGMPAGALGAVLVVAPSYVNAQTGTTYTLQATDWGKIVSITNAAEITVTVPVGLPTGFNCLIDQDGAGQITIVGADGVTLKSYLSMARTAGVDAQVSVWQRGTETYKLTGNLQ